METLQTDILIIGASQDRVYNAARLTEAPLTRLFEDVQTTSQWRSMGFSPVLNEHKQTPRVNIRASVMHQMLALKRENPLPHDAVLDDSYELGLNREQKCPKPDEIDDFAEEYPLGEGPTPRLPWNEFTTCWWRATMFTVTSGTRWPRACIWTSCAWRGCPAVGRCSQ